jgi:hypothetical protein
MKWIDANIETPENGTWCLCWERHISKNKSKILIGYYDCGFMPDESGYRVTHWMLLPDEPGEGKP